MTSVMPQMRAEKTSKNQDDLRVMLAGTMFLIFLIFIKPIVLKVYDEFFAERPFITATVQILGVEGSDIPVILYHADAKQPVIGQWIASIHSYEKGQPERITSRRGNGSYNPNLSSPRVWSWGAFFDNEQDVSIPEVPVFPFKICVRYDVNARDSGVGDETDYYCSEVFDPQKPDNLLYDFVTDGDIR